MQVNNNMNTSALSCSKTGSTGKNTYINKDIPNDSVEFSKSNKKKTAKKILIAAGLAAVTVAAVLKYKQIKIIKEMPEELRPLFKELKGKEGQEFVDAAYQGIIKQKGLEKMAPKAVKITEKADGIFDTVTGGYNPLDNSIEFSKGFIKKLPKKAQFNLLAHETEHCKQFNDIARTEGLGIEKLAEAFTKKKTENLKVIGTVSEEEIKRLKEEAVKKSKEEFTNQLDSAFKHIKGMPRYAKDSPEGKKALEYIEAFENYKGLSLFGSGSKEYYENLLEKEAYSTGKKMERYFNAMMSPFEKIKDFFRVITSK